MKNSYVNKKFKNYNCYNTSEAYDYNKIYNNEPIKRKKKKKYRKNVKYKYSKNRREGISFSTYLVLFIFFASSIFITISYSTVTMERKNNSILQKKLNTLENETYKLSQSLLESINLEYIENIAKTKLDMKEPENYQIVYIDVPKKSYIVQVSEIEKKNISLKEKLKKLLKNFNENLMKDDYNGKIFKEKNNN